MKQETNSNHYLSARKLGMKEYSRYISQGRTGYLPFLEGILKNIDIISEVDLGIVEVPLDKIKGTYTYLRSISFARNFMPIMNEHTEFSIKWENVCKIQSEEGLRDPIKVYEYLNWFYVVEGNKRVSVLKYLDVYSYPAQVSRLIPKYDEENPDIRLYYEFLDFNKKTGINAIWFSKEGSFNTLWEMIKDYCPEGSMIQDSDRFKYFVSAVYLNFKKAYVQLGGDKLAITTGDAFLEYIKVYGFDKPIDPDDIFPILRRFISELAYFGSNESVEIHTEPVKRDETGNIINRLSNIIKHEKLKVGFAYTKNFRTSTWTYAHDMGRRHLDNVLSDQIRTQYIDDAGNLDDYDKLKKLADNGNKIIFATDPAMIKATLKIATEYPNIKFLNCSGDHSFRYVNSYYGRIYEPRFLSGIIAGVMTKTNTVGYITTYPIPEIISSVNAFALGAKMVNPDIRVRVEWTMAWDHEAKSRAASCRLMEYNADILCHHKTLANKNFSKEYGVYTMQVDKETGECIPDKYIASPVWNWGIFYEKIIRSILAGQMKTSGESIFSGSKSVINYWWGMDSGILDFFYSASLVPVETQKMVELIKNAIISKAYHVFTGPINDTTGKMQVERGESATREQILTMDWFVDCVETEIPSIIVKEIISDLSTGRL